MSETETGSQNTFEEAREALSEGSSIVVPPLARTSSTFDVDGHPGTHHPPDTPSVLPPRHTLPPSPIQRRHAGATNSSTQHDLNQIIAHAREDIRHLREELTRHETQTVRIAQERDEIQHQYTNLYANFLEAVHIAAEEEIRQIGYSLRPNPESLPKLLEPVYESITLWLEKQQAEREKMLSQKIDDVAQQAQAMRQEIMREREVLNAAREQVAQQRQTLNTQIKAREAWLKNRWFARAWGTTALMFLILPALQVYLLLQKADSWNIILIPTTICLVLIGLISLARSRMRPRPSGHTSTTNSG